MRKLIGVSLNYDLDTDKFPKFIRNGNYVLQNAENTGISLENDVNVDLSVEEIISGFEAKYGKIDLSDCDWETGLKETYNCSKAANSDYALETLRNNYISKKVIQTKDNKILMLYGQAHYKPIRDKLIESGFEEVD
jgi:hypothetical protein